MHKQYGEFDKRGAVVVAIAQEDKDLESHGKILKKIRASDPQFIIAADIGHTTTTAFDRTSVYLIDKDGVVRQIFPMLIHERASWEPVWRAMDEL